MIKLEKTDVFGWEAAIRGMRNPMNSWDKSDSGYKPVTCPPCNDITIEYVIGENDLKLMKSLSKAGSDHSKFLRMINVTVDITAPLYWWKEFDTYKVGTVANSCSTMHKIHEKEFTLDDFSCEHLDGTSMYILKEVIRTLNDNRTEFVEFDDGDKAIQNLCGENKKDYWWQMIQLLPSSYNQKRTIHLNYQVLKSMYFARNNHKLDCWRAFCKWCESLPYFKEICIEC
jgi:hypothetical protein